MKQGKLQVSEKLFSMQFGSRTISTENKAFIMGIVNVTPDSFYSESRGGIEHAEELIKEGANGYYKRFGARFV